jgi:uncharacterized membrane protein YccC
MSSIKLPSWTQGAFAVRLIVAALAAYGLSALAGFAHGYSAVFSALIVVRPYQQGAWRAAGQRLLATALGIATAFASVWLHRSGLNDYELLAIAIAPLSLLVAYDSGYRTAMISALIMLSAGVSAAGVRLPEFDVALGRAFVVGLGAVVGVAVSLLVLPQPHHQTVARKALQIIRLMLGTLHGALDQESGAKLDKADGQLRKYLLELGQMARDHTPHNADEDASNRIVGLTRHIQSLAILLRAEWRREALSEGAKNARYNVISQLLPLLDQLENAARGRASEVVPLDMREALGDLETIGEAPEKWLLASLYRDLIGLSRLVSPALPGKSPAA